MWVTAKRTHGIIAGPMEGGRVINPGAFDNGVKEVTVSFP